jgi:hypothetical protein
LTGGEAATYSGGRDGAERQHAILDPEVVFYHWTKTKTTTKLLETEFNSEDIAVPFRPLVVETNCKKCGGILC